MRTPFALCLFIALGCGSVEPAAGGGIEPPVIPVALDAYRQWDKWPLQRIGARAYMRSTYDRKGGNESADASHYLYQESDEFNVPLDVEGPGILYFARYNHWHGSPWHYEVDGRDHIVQESSSKDPNKPVENSVFLPEAAFPSPLTFTWSQTKGADLMWVPIPFEKSFRMAYTRTRYGTGYYIYHQYARDANLSQPIKSWNEVPPAQDVLDLIGRAGSNLFPGGEAPKAGVPGVVRAIELSAPKDQAIALGRGRIRITWDDRATPSVDAPIALFFGAGTLYNRDGREVLVKAFPMNIRFDADRVHLACYYPMPYFKSAKVELVGVDSIPGVKLDVRSEPLREPKNHVGYFHATYVDVPQPVKGEDMVFLDTQGVEGGQDWSGSFVGMSWIFSHNANLGTLEGDPRFFFDDSLTPQGQGTGTEEWGGGGDYWGGRNMTLPFAGHPCGAKGPKESRDPEDLIESAYRFLLADLMPFGRRAKIHLEHGGTNTSAEHYECVTYWYGSPGAALVKTDEFQVGDEASEKAHGYASPDASAPEELASRYEWGPDSIGGKEVYPATTERGRRTRGSSEFRLALDPDNLGVLLRRKLDYSFPNQRAEVFVADEGSTDWRSAGVWYLAGSNTCIYSDAKGELGATQHNVQTSNRRFRDDEFLVPRALTKGRRAIRVRVKFAPVDRALYPGHPYPVEPAWSELRYTAYSWILR
ncbi:MAG TPA: DUF2961 domain-containing protein [Planctomycetota bacterium]|nr:DUF2961 domain-containing protein [Planctomycetota bacterium]